MEQYLIQIVKLLNPTTVTGYNFLCKSLDGEAFAAKGAVLVLRLLRNEFR